MAGLVPPDTVALQWSGAINDPTVQMYIKEALPRRAPPSHGGNAGSNPAGDASVFNGLDAI
jgi:hypothetical protein